MEDSNNPIKALKDEANAEVMDSLLESFMPKLKVMIPKAIKYVDENDDVIVGMDDMVLIGRSEENGCVHVITVKKEDVNVSIDEGADYDEKDLGALFEKLLNMFSNR